LLSYFFGAVVEMPKLDITLFTKLFVKVALISSFTFSYSASASLDIVLEKNNPVSLFGIGVHQEKRFDIYVGALYAPSTVTDISALSDQYIAKRMSLKFISKYSNRKMARMWKQRIAMNNAKSQWRPLTKEIVQFASLFKRAMQSGDEVNIDYIPSVGTKVYLNATEFMTIKKPEFFELLLNIWLGSVPPTEKFKTGISGANPQGLQAELIAKFDALTPVVGRFDKDLKKPETQVASAVKKPNNTSKSKPQATQPSKKSNTATKKEKPTPAITQAQAKQIAATQADNAPPANSPSKKPEVSKSGASKDLLFKTDLGAKKIVKLDQPKPKLENSQINSDSVNNLNQSEPSKSDTIPAVKKVAKLDPPEEFFDADLLSGSYTQELINTIKKYQSYPKRALAAGEEGNVTALVTIDKDGEILDYEITERAASRTLNREVLRMIRRAAPFPKIPPELKLKQFEFEVPMNFKLAN
jgi:periplasmic protein TonB